MSKTIVLGASGQLGQCLKNICEKRGITEFIFPPEEEANILDAEALEKLFVAHQPAYAVNCAAYTAVDKAEDDVDVARKVNRDGPEIIARLCQKYGIVLVHVSTDFVFKGDEPRLLNEEDVAEPINIYGLTKLEGEQVITAATDKYYIIRTSWLYSEYGNNFVKAMLKLGAERDELGIIADQIGSPTYAIDLAGAIVDIIVSGKDAYGIYHYSNEGVTSWYDFAVGVFDISNTTVKVKPIKSTEYVTKAIRPAFSVMDKSKIKSVFNIAIPYWRESLTTCINILQTS
ncbi:dTDP-4-dehydrorhamnose reductase [Mucilaginibacter yixingensis]|uniref:dTDP-4-dehydrorhamnose reductase n=1 Tax=Mucilaginibacter yixingensis TaxID=1295612 RepID=A0A2T5JC40_9SPHI|nr:dTDP-4-dehydrorhamnose reductase [Mucilaginibacter yixingensis]PTQ99320.1 dTDP-4-dehydrorhamnose reductase [Mucilaginibacter yixingensis]